MIELINGDCREILPRYDRMKMIIVTDPPFNIGYKYNKYKDKMDKAEYLSMLSNICKGGQSVIIHYPEALYSLSISMGVSPEKVVSWVYNSNTKKQHRDIAFFGIYPDFSKVKQPYKNPNDKRVKKLLESGRFGTDIYDWWFINQVKNVSKEKTNHPCQMPLQVMENVIAILPENYIICDPFMGSGTTGVACKKHNRSFVGIEIDEEYFKIAKQRIEGVNDEEVSQQRG